MTIYDGIAIEKGGEHIAWVAMWGTSLCIYYFYMKQIDRGYRLQKPWIKF